MSSAWLLPEHIADVLPAQARHIETLRGVLLGAARGYGFELVMPPLLEHLDSLLGPSDERDHGLDLKTFKLVDQLSGRALGVRADTTPQVARIDAHLLNRQGVTRLCYCGPVLHTRPAGVSATREPLQFGAETYGHAGLEADLEIQDLALDCLRSAGLAKVTLDVGDARILRGVLAGSEHEANVDAERLAHIASALDAKDAPALEEASKGLPAHVANALRVLLRLYGSAEVLDAAASQLPPHPLIRAALADLRWLGKHIHESHPEVRIGFDLSDLGDYAYYTGIRFAAYVEGGSDAILRGGRYDEVGAAFGRPRPAVGFSLDLKELAALVPAAAPRPAIRAPWGQDTALRAAIRQCRERGDTVVCMLPGHDHEGQEFGCDRELVAQGGQWVVRAL